MLALLGLRIQKRLALLRNGLLPRALATSTALKAASSVRLTLPTIAMTSGKLSALYVIYQNFNTSLFENVDNKLSNWSIMGHVLRIGNSTGSVQPFRWLVPICIVLLCQFMITTAFKVCRSTNIILFPPPIPAPPFPLDSMFQVHRFDQRSSQLPRANVQVLGARGR